MTEKNEEKEKQKRFELLRKNAKPYNPDSDDMKPGIYKTNTEVVFRIINTHLLTGITVLGDNSEDVIKPGIYETKVPIIPQDIVEEVIRFFRFVFSKFGNAEAIVLLWLHPETGKWEIEIPKQEVASASLDYTRDSDYTDQMMQKGFKLIGTIHSHGSMGAFHSGTDDHDEFWFDGLHITIGHVMTDPEFACRYIMKDWYTKKEPEDVLEYQHKEELYPKFWDRQVKKKTYTHKKPTGKSPVNQLFYDDGDYGWEDWTEEQKKKQWLQDNDELVS